VRNTPHNTPSQAPGTGLDGHSLGYHRAQVKAEAVRHWETQYHDNPRTSHAYTHILRDLPTGHLPPTHGAIYGFRKTKPDGTTTHHHAHVSRRTPSTVFRIATGHAFVGAFHTHPERSHAWNEVMEEMVSCECGELPQTVEHVILECPHYHTARAKHLLVHGRPQALMQLFSHPLHSIELLRFLEETRACATPRTVWEPR
jgi:hypothetical protein